IRGTEDAISAEAEHAKDAIYNIVVDACRAYSGDTPLRPEDVLPQQVSAWFNTRAAALTANVVRELGRAAERMLGQYKSLTVRGRETIDNFMGMMQTLDSDTYLCAQRD